MRDKPYTLSQVMANFESMREVTDLNWCQQFAASVLERGINAMPVECPPLLTDNAQLRLLVQSLADPRMLRPGREAAKYRRLANAAAREALGTDCREASNKVQSLKVVVEVDGGVAEVTTCPAGVEVEIVDHDNN